MNLKEKKKQLEEDCKVEGERLLVKHKERIISYCKHYGSYYSIGNFSAILVPELDVLRVRFEVGRKEPLFEDYYTEKDVPLDYLESSNPKQWIKDKDLDEKIIKKEKQRKELEKKIVSLTGDIRDANEALRKAKEELSNL